MPHMEVGTLSKNTSYKFISFETNQSVQKRQNIDFSFLNSISIVTVYVVKKNVVNISPV